MQNQTQSDFQQLEASIQQLRLIFGDDFYPTGHSIFFAFCFRFFELTF